MAKRTSKSSNSKFTLMVGKEAKGGIGGAKHHDDGRIVTYGAVIVRSEKSVRVTAANIKAGQDALKRAKTKLLRPGVTLKVGKNTALYRADPDNPGGLIREINGRIERVVFEGDTFKVRA